MSKSYKLKDGNYIDSTGIVHNKQLLSNVLKDLIDGTNYYEDMTILVDWLNPNGNRQEITKIGNMIIYNITFNITKTITLSNNTAIAQIPSEVRPIANKVFSALQSGNGIFAYLRAYSGEIMAKGTFTSGNELSFVALYTIN